MEIQMEGFVSFHENGQLAETAEFRRGMPIGNTVSYYPDGKTMEVVSHNNLGQIEKILLYFENGNLQKEIHFINGQEDGDAIEYFENGKIREIIPYKAGKPEGTNQLFDLEGELIHEKFYEEGKLIGTKIYQAEEKSNK
jgi:uncharacterized protein